MSLLSKLDPTCSMFPLAMEISDALTSCSTSSPALWDTVSLTINSGLGSTKLLALEVRLNLHFLLLISMALLLHLPWPMGCL